MENRFEVVEIRICTFNHDEQGRVKPDYNYPERLAIIDKSRNVVIDVEHQLEYDYIETISGLYLKYKLLDKVDNGKRAAIFPFIILFLEQEKQEKIDKIIEYLKSGGRYTNGNLVLNNEQYLERIEKENIEKQKEETKKETPQKVKKIGSIFRKREK